MVAGVDGVAHGKVQGLGDGGRGFGLVGGDAAASTATEALEDVVAKVRSLGGSGGARVVINGAGAFRETTKAARDAGDGDDAVDKDIGAEAAEVGAGKLAVVAAVGVVRSGAELVGPGGADVTHEGAEAELGGDEMRGEVGEQRLINRRIGHAHVIHGMDDAAAHKLRPDAVGEVAAEKFVVG